MTRRRALVHLTVTALVAGLLLAPVAAAAASPAARATTDSTAADSTATGSTAPAQLAAPTTHTLITGDRVAIGTASDGRPTVTWLSGPTGAKAFQLIAGGGHLYVLPMSAAPLLGGVLSLDLFDVAALPQASGTTLAVSYRGSGRRLPAGLTASGPGTVTVTDPAAFGRALAGQWQASRHGKQARLGDVATLAPATATKPKKQPPAGALHTLRIRAVDRNGDPADADVVAVNVESADDYIAGQQLFDGAAAFSVPTGHYSISGMVPTTEADGSVSWTMVSAPQVTVTRPTSVILDARHAVPVTLTTPTAADPLVSTLTYQRGDTVGSGFTQSFTTFGPTSLYVVPVGSVTIGDLYFAATWNNASADGSTSYDVIKGQAGSIGRDWDYRPGPADLATVHADYVSPIPGRAELTSRIGLVPGVGVLSSVGYQIAAPTSRTEYVSAAPDLEWVPSLAADAIGDSGWTAGPARIFRGGEDISVRWLGQPMASGVQQQDGVQPLPCPFCIQDGQLLTAFAPLVDADGHWMYRAAEASEQLTVSRDGTPVGTSRSGSGGFDVSTPGRYTASYRVTLDAPWWTTSTAVSTDWSFDSTATEPLPAGWTCGGGKGGGGGGKGGDGTAAAPAGPPNGDGTCTLPALLLPSYQTPAGTDAVQPAGQPATVDVRVARPAGAVQQDLATFSAAVSFDDGSSWTELDPTRTGPDSFRLQYWQPDLAATNGFATLRIAATDATGASVQQTVTRAYPLAVTDVPPPPAGPPTRSDLADVCSAPVAPPFASCFARITPAAAAASADEPAGLSPADIRSAYRLGSAGGDGVTVAVVVAYDSPTAEADLAVYRQHWGLPACTSADGCFTKVNQRGDPGPLPPMSSGWAVEAALDLDAISATCPGCRLLLVEADSSSTVDLLNAALTASRLGADVISNSYGSTGEFSGEQLYEPYYRSIRVPFVVATGDYGYGNGLPLVGGVSYPAASASAIAVGGTTLTRADTARGWTESAWALGTSGCSAYIGKPAWQKDTLCRMRTVADISAVGDPATGLAVYETSVVGGWVTVGGTSLSAPLVSGMIAVAGPARMPGNGPTRFAAELYAHPGLFNDVTAGSNGTNCSATYLCTALPGFDGPTGLGTPDGVAAFRSGRR